MDTVDLANASQRQRFIIALVAKLPSLDKQAIELELLRIADASKAPVQPAAGDTSWELDVDRIVRPEMFITPEVSGIAVPVAIMLGEKAAGRWMVYLRWIDGRRECRELCPTIDLREGDKLFVHPIPGEPSLTAKPSWSSAARQSWLSGASAPNPVGVFKRICERIAHFIDLPQDVAPGTTAMLALWSILTYCFRAWDAVPYL